MLQMSFAEITDHKSQDINNMQTPTDPQAGKINSINYLRKEECTMKNILIIQGGGRPKGNTAQLTASFEKGAADAGHSVETISLLKNEVKGCLGCNACRYGKPCIQKDSFNELIPKIKNADLIVIEKNG